jgi:hypothetical protein
MRTVMPSVFLLSVVLLFLIFLAKMLHDNIKERKRLDRRASLLKQWASDQLTQPRVKYRKIEIRLPKS